MIDVVVEERPGAAAMRVFVDKAPFLLARANQICTALFAPLSGGETLAQAEFLLALGELSAPSQQRLALATGVDTSTTSYLIDNLDAAGLAERSVDPGDRRRSQIRLTPRGTERLVATRASFGRLQAIFGAPLPHGEMLDFCRILSRVAARTDLRAPPWQPSSKSVLASAPSVLCRRALQVSEGELIASTRAIGLTPRQFSLLHLLSDIDGLTQIGFARLFGLDPATCAVIMRSLSARGLIEARTSSADRRQRLYRITADGHAARAAAQPLVDASERHVLATVDADELRFLTAALRRLIAANNDRLRFPGEIDFTDHHTP